MSKCKVQQFGIASAEQHEELVLLVQEQLNNGWQLHGFVFQSMRGDRVLLQQALVTDKSPEKPKATKKKQSIKP